MTKKRNWKFWTGRTILGLLVIGGLWLTNLIWFKPFNIKHFYDKVFVQGRRVGELYVINLLQDSSLFFVVFVDVCGLSHD